MFCDTKVCFCRHYKLKRKLLRDSSRNVKYDLLTSVYGFQTILKLSQNPLMNLLSWLRNKNRQKSVPWKNTLQKHSRWFILGLFSSVTKHIIKTLHVERYFCIHQLELNLKYMSSEIILERVQFYMQIHIVLPER